MQTAKLFQNGQSQAVRLPKEFRMKGEKVFIKKIGKATLLIPFEDSWEDFFKSIYKFSDDFMEKREQPKQKERDDLFL